LVCHTPELQLYTTQRLYAALHRDFSQESLTLAAVWVIGEFGEILLQGGSFEDEDLVREVYAKDIVDTLASVLESPYANSHIRQWVLTSLAKLTARIGSDGTNQSRIAKLLHNYDTSVDVELQTRAIEFESLLSRPDIRDGVLEPMPPPELKQTVIGTVSEKRDVGSTRRDKDALLDLMGDEGSTAVEGHVAPAGNGKKQQTTQDLLADIFGGMGDDTPSTAATSSATGASGPPKSSMDDIMGLFGSTSNGSNTGSTFGASRAVSNPSSSSGNGLDGLDLLGGSSAPTASSPPPQARPAASSTSFATAATPAPAPQQQQGYTAYDQKGLKVTLTPSVNASKPEIVNITARFEASSGSVLENVNFQAAVPKVSRWART
jgi:AP-1 complex subunit gamma-1